MPLFPIGRVCLMPGAARELSRAGESPATYLARHEQGDYGEATDAENWEQNNYAIHAGLKIWSHYRLPTGVEIVVVTDRERAWTHILLPEEHWSRSRY